VRCWTVLGLPGLSPGVDPGVRFTPERTAETVAVEGDALDDGKHGYAQGEAQLLGGVARDARDQRLAVAVDAHLDDRRIAGTDGGNHAGRTLSALMSLGADWARITSRRAL
jgi:hypothetical protein